MGQYTGENSTWAATVRSAARQGTLSHAVILSGGGDTLSAGRYLAAAYLCRGTGKKPCLACNDCRKVMAGIHPDVIDVQPAKTKELSAEETRALRQDIYIRPNEGVRKIYLFADCRQLNERDQDILLKVVEEGPAYAVFLFCTPTVHALLPTIRSRCAVLRVEEGDLSPRGEDETASALCRAIAAGQAAAVTELLLRLEGRALKREGLLSLLQSLWEASARALLCRYGGAGELSESAALLSQRLDGKTLAALESLWRRYLDECRYNVGVGHVLGAMAAELDDIL